MINLRSELHLALLGYYFDHPGAEHYMRELSRMLSFDVSHLSRELNLLTRSGIFLATTRGRERYFRINRAHPLYGEMEKLVRHSAFVEKKSRARSGR